MEDIKSTLAIIASIYVGSLAGSATIYLDLSYSMSTLCLLLTMISGAVIGWNLKAKESCDVE